MSVSQHTEIQSFIDYLKYEKRYSVNTIRSYTDDLYSFLAFLHQHYGASELSTAEPVYIRSWMAYLKEQGLTARTINRKISTLKSFFKYQMKQGRISFSPMNKIISPKISKKLPVFIKEDDTKKLLTAISSSTEDWKSLNASLIIYLLYATGIRLSELTGLKLQQIDFIKKQMKVLGKGNKERVIPVHDDILKMILEYEEKKLEITGSGSDYLLVTEKGKKLYPKYVYNLVKKALGSELKTLDKKSPHVLRHTFATHLMNSGANLDAVKELLGHSSLTTTQIYTHNTIGKLKEVHKKSHPKA